MSERAARALLGCGVVALLVGATAANLPALARGQFWGDGATYYSMAWSFAQDLDMRYETRDLLRVRREFPGGPQGVFLKRSAGGIRLDPDAGFPWIGRVPEERPRIYFAKPFVYSLVAAPFVRVFGTRGLLLTNALSLAACLLMGYSMLRMQTGPGRALAATLALYGATVAPVYLLWPAPELFNMSLVAAGLWAVVARRPVLSALLLGVATYSKPYNLWLAIPLGMAPLLSRDGALASRLLESVRRGAVLAGTVLALFAANAALTGEANYQGGRERKTFYGRFPGEVEVVDGRSREVTFGNAGTWMSTNQAGPRVEGEDDVSPAQGAEPPRSAEELRQSFLYNLAYFWVGRFGGALAYFFPFLVALALFLGLGPRSQAGALAVGAVVVSWLFYILMIPDNWYGGSGTVGNRYFLNLLPLALLLLPRGREAAFALLAAAGGAAFVAPLLAAPMAHSLGHGAYTRRLPFRALPAELTMLNDLAVFGDGWRKKQPVGDTEGDPWRHWPADPNSYYLYFPDDGSFGREEGPGGVGFWLRAGSEAEVLLRALEPVRALHVELHGGPAGDAVQLETAGGRLSLKVPAGREASGVIEPKPGFRYKDSFVHVLRFRSQGGGSGPDGRPLGAFVRLRLDVEKRPAR